MSMFLFLAQSLLQFGFAMSNLNSSVPRIRAGFWLRDFQYNAERYQAASLEERAVAAPKLRRAQEAVDRLCGCHEWQD